jgi:FkbM family methyltransferase
MGINIIQIGAYKGDDDFTEIIKKIKPSDIDNIILVEPQKDFNKNLNKVYSGFNFNIENLVISPNEDDDEIIFYTSNKDEDKEVSSIDKNHLLKHNCTDFTENKIKCTTVNKLLTKYKIDFLDILFIDAEGSDDKIIKSIDFNKFYIKKIYFENLHINNEDIISFLKKKNYSITQGILTNGWTNEAIKND